MSAPPGMCPAARFAYAGDARRMLSRRHAISRADAECSSDKVGRCGVICTGSFCGQTPMAKEDTLSAKVRRVPRKQHDAACRVRYVSSKQHDSACKGQTCAEQTARFRMQRSNMHLANSMILNAKVKHVPSKQHDSADKGQTCTANNSMT